MKAKWGTVIAAGALAFAACSSSGDSKTLRPASEVRKDEQNAKEASFKNARIGEKVDVGNGRAFTITEIASRSVRDAVGTVQPALYVKLRVVDITVSRF